MSRNQFRRRALGAPPFNARWPFWVALFGALGLGVYLKRKRLAEAAESASEAASEAAQYVEEAISSITDKADWAKAMYGVVSRELPTVPR